MSGSQLVMETMIASGTPWPVSCMHASVSRTRRTDRQRHMRSNGRELAEREGHDSPEDRESRRENNSKVSASYDTPGAFQVHPEDGYMGCTIFLRNQCPRARSRIGWVGGLRYFHTLHVRNDGAGRLPEPWPQYVIGNHDVAGIGSSSTIRSDVLLFAGRGGVRPGTGEAGSCV